MGKNKREDGFEKMDLPVPVSIDAKKKKKKSLLIKIGSGKAKIQNAYDPKDQFNGKYIFLEVFVFKVTLPISTHGLQS